MSARKFYRIDLNGTPRHVIDEDGFFVADWSAGSVAEWMADCPNPASPATPPTMTRTILQLRSAFRIMTLRLCNFLGHSGGENVAQPAGLSECVKKPRSGRLWSAPMRQA